MKGGDADQDTDLRKAALANREAEKNQSKLSLIINDKENADASEKFAPNEEDKNDTTSNKKEWLE